MTYLLSRLQNQDERPAVKTLLSAGVKYLLPDRLQTERHVDVGTRIVGAVEKRSRSASLCLNQRLSEQAITQDTFLDGRLEMEIQGRWFPANYILRRDVPLPRHPEEKGVYHGPSPYREFFNHWTGTPSLMALPTCSTLHNWRPSFLPLLPVPRTLVSANAATKRGPSLGRCTPMKSRKLWKKGNVLMKIYEMHRFLRTSEPTDIFSLQNALTLSSKSNGKQAREVETCVLPHCNLLCTSPSIPYHKTFEHPHPILRHRLNQLHVRPHQKTVQFYSWLLPGRTDKRMQRWQHYRIL